MKIQKYIKHIGLLILCLSTVIIYFLMTNHYTSIFRSFNIPFILSHTSVDIVSENITTINETISNLTILNETISNLTIINQTIPNLTISNITISNVTIINETISNLAILNETISNLTIIIQTIPNLTISNITISNVTIINETITNLTFESRLSNWYPHLPIHIFTQNLSSLSNTSKLILIGNGFFGNQGWGVAGPGRSSTEIMNLLKCPFLSNYCDITTDYNRFSEADAVVYHMRDGIDRTTAQQKRKSNQRFVFALWESPAHTPNLESYRNFFNWTMTYRFESHVIASYYSGSSYIHTSSDFYRLMLHENSTKKLNLIVEKFDHRPSNEILEKKKLGLAAALISNCGGSSNRLGFINQLKRYIDVKVYGRCGEGCPANMNCRKFIAENYYFILSFENSLCTDYTTEKFFDTLQHPIVPVVLGRTNYSYFIPSSGYIETNDFSTMKSLAEYLNQTRYDKEKYLSYFTWKKDYVSGLLHWFTPFCDLCVRLHLDSKPNIIEDMQKWWFDGACQAPRTLS